MIGKILLPGVFLLLSYGFWVSPDFNIIAAGIAIFLFGMLSLERGFVTFSGGILQQILHTATDKLWKRLGFGIISTILTQSSSLVSVLIISFLSAGLLDLAAGMGIVFAANLGTTTGAWLVAGFGVKVKIAAYAMPMLVFGILLVLQKSAQLKGVGYILSGIGFLFLGIHYMKDGFEALRATLNLTEYALPGIKGLVIYVLIGIVATVIIQSSDATMVLIITALSVRQITYENALAMAIGANIGTTVTAVIGSISANIQGKRLAAAHLLFNFITALIALVFINQFIWLVDFFSTSVGIDTDDYALKLAAFHSLFNLVGITLMLPLVNIMAGWLKQLLKAKPIMVDQPKFLNDAVITYPETVIAAVRRETLHLHRNIIGIILKILGFSIHDIYSQMDLQKIVEKHRNIPDFDVDAAYNSNVKGIYSAIMAFISEANIAWGTQQSRSLYALREANRHIVEALKGCKHLQKNLYRISLSYDAVARAEYNKIRYQLALIIREIDTFRQQALVEELAILSLDNLKAKIEEQDQQMNQSIDALIREKKISPAIGTSLINDSAYMYDIKQHLIAMAETVFVVGQASVVEAEKQLSLDKAELLDVISSSGNDKTHS